MTARGVAHDGTSALCHHPLRRHRDHVILGRDQIESGLRLPCRVGHCPCSASTPHGTYERAINAAWLARHRRRMRRRTCRPRRSGIVGPRRAPRAGRGLGGQPRERGGHALAVRGAGLVRRTAGCGFARPHAGTAPLRLRDDDRRLPLRRAAAVALRWLPHRRRLIRSDGRAGRIRAACRCAAVARTV